MNNKELAKKIARKIFECGDATDSKCRRMQFKGGSWPDNELDQGGIAEAPMSRLIEEVLANK